MPTTLRAYYDLAVSPVTYNVVDFLYMAEMERLYLGMDAIDFVVVANNGGGFRHDRLSLSESGKAWRLRNIVLAAGALLPSCRDTLYFRDRSDAEMYFDPTIPTFPSGYTVDQPVADYHDYGILRGKYLGRPFASLRAPQQARKFVEQWVASRVPERTLVTITLRDSPVNHPLRNSNTEDWLRFADGLDSEEYSPLFVRDTGRIFEPVDDTLHGHEYFDLASLNLELRLALYEIAYLNLFVDSGPATLCFVDDVTRGIRFKLLPEANPDAIPGVFHARGYESGMQFAHCTNYQRSVWKEDTFDTIKEEFAAMVEQIESETTVAHQPLPPVKETATRLLIGNNARETKILCNLMLQENGNDLEAQFLLAKAHQSEGSFNYASGLLEKIAMLAGDPPEVLYALGQCLADARREDEAISVLETALAATPHNVPTTVELAKLYERTGRDEEAAAFLEKALQANQNSAELIHTFATIRAVDNVTLDEAISNYARVMELRPDITVHRQLAMCHARLGQYDLAARTFLGERQFIRTVKAEDHVIQGMLLRYAGRTGESITELERAAKKFDEKIARSVRERQSTDKPLAGKARAFALMDHHDAAREIYAEIVNDRPIASFTYESNTYYADTNLRIDNLKSRHSGRDIFILCHGHSIKTMLDYSDSLHTADAAIFGLNRFRSLEKSVLEPAGRQFDLVMITHIHNFGDYLDHVSEYLERGVENSLITNRATLDRIRFAELTTEEVERRWKDRILLIEGPGGNFPPTPNAPLRFLHGNTLSGLIALTVLLAPKRIFLFGADGGIPKNSTEETHYYDRSTASDWRIDLGNMRRNNMIDALHADAVEFRDTLEMNLIALESLFGVSRPPIYNVSPESRYEGIPKIGYAEAWNLIAATN